jgi:hypothetical protein
VLADLEDASRHAHRRQPTRRSGDQAGCAPSVPSSGRRYSSGAAKWQRTEGEHCDAICTLSFAERLATALLASAGRVVDLPMRSRWLISLRSCHVPPVALTGDAGLPRSYAWPGSSRR